MKRMLVMAALMAAGAAHAQQATPAEGHAALQHLIGSWTIEGKEATYKEACAWYHGERHVVCHTESVRKDGTVGHSMSILGHVPGQGYVYTGIGASGRYETYKGGTFADGVLEYLDRTGEETVRIRMGPFTDGPVVPFQVHTSKDGKTWESVDAFNYVRLTSSP